MSLSFSNDYNRFRDRYSMPLNRMFGDRNMHEVFSALNFSIIFIKPFFSNLITQPFQSVLFKC